MKTIKLVHFDMIYLINIIEFRDLAAEMFYQAYFSVILNRCSFCLQWYT